jgi:hypothetical protein
MRPGLRRSALTSIAVRSLGMAGSSSAPGVVGLAENQEIRTVLGRSGPDQVYALVYRWFTEDAGRVEKKKSAEVPAAQR